MKKNIFKIIIITVLTIILFPACVDSIVTNVPSIDEKGSSVKIKATFSDIQKNIFNKTCAVSGCHAGSVNPDLSDNSYNNIVNKQSSSGNPYIKPFDPANSYLLQKVLDSTKINGSRMPLNNPPLSNEEINTIITWIKNGAKNN